MKEISYSYSGTGIKTLKISSLIFLIICVLAAFILIFQGSDNDEPVFYLYAIFAVLSGFLTLGTGYALATIAENSLLQKAKLKSDLKDNETTFVEVKD
ncbi:MAG TPA: hypothetical protein GXZ87_05390 [Bacteroidales bacterium]|nr:hypothetical protein [Bacteroidales bacterium]